MPKNVGGKNMTITKRILSLTMVLVMICSLFTIGTITASAAELPFRTATWTLKGRLTDGYGSPSEVYTTGATAKLRICTFNQNGKRTSGKITVKAVADSGAVYTWNVKGCNSFLNNTTNITLPKGNTHYKIYIKRNGTSNSNRTNTYYVSIDYIKNCARPY